MPLTPFPLIHDDVLFAFDHLTAFAFDTAVRPACARNNNNYNNSDTDTSNNIHNKNNNNINA